MEQTKIKNDVNTLDDNIFQKSQTIWLPSHPIVKSFKNNVLEIIPQELKDIHNDSLYDKFKKNFENEISPILYRSEDLKQFRDDNFNNIFETPPIIDSAVAASGCGDKISLNRRRTKR